MLILTQNKKCLINMDNIANIHIMDTQLVADDIGAGSFDFESYLRMTQK